MTIRGLIRCIVVVLIVSSGKGCKPQPPPAPPTPPTSSTNGLEGEERTRWHHLAEGSEVFPLSWLLAMVNRNTGKPFLENPERFGLLSDPDRGAENPYGLPVGLTAAEAKDTRFLKIQMVGVNCAACHVNELHSQGKPVMRIDGAPNLFDLGTLFQELALDTKAVYTDPGKAWEFAQRLYRVYSPAERTIKFSPYKLDSVAPPALEQLSTLKSSAPLEKELASTIEKLHAAELQAPIQPLEQNLKVSVPDEDLREFVAELDPNVQESKPMSKGLSQKWLQFREKSVGRIKLGNIKSIATKKPSPASPMAGLTEPQRENNLTAALDHFVETVRLLKQRAAFLLRLSQSQDAHDTAGGFGRVDAFGGARNFMFPEQHIPLNAPISYPHLWNLNQMVWFHWDANTTSLLERNVGQAIGLGAIFDPQSHVSTILIKNIEDLERLTGKITPPVWPAKEFGPIDPNKKEQGRVLFATYCASCHKPLEPGGNMADVKSPLHEILSDPLRAENFAQKVGNKEFSAALSENLKAIIRKAGGTVKDENEWRVTRAYAGRPLVAPWATAPYLHNNSVPTLYDLLLAPSKRPQTFPVGRREYDPVKLGYATEGAGSPSSIFDTSKTGNSNTGHEYGVTLTDPERMALLEYLKSL